VIKAKPAPAPCECGGTCRTCTDPLLLEWKNDAQAHHAAWRTADLGKNTERVTVPVGSLANTQLVVNLPRRLANPSIAEFEAGMSALYERLRGHV
jgi:hypothetical protein